MTDRTERLARLADAERDRLSAMVDALGDDVQARLDWRTYVRRTPMLALGVVGLAGLAFGMRRGGRAPASRAPRDFPSALARTPAQARPSATARLARQAVSMLTEVLIARALERYAQSRRSRSGASSVSRTRKVRGDDPAPRRRRSTLVND